MLRAIAGVILGYLTTALLVMALFTGLFFAFGVENVFRPGTYDTTTAWNVATLVGSLLCAVAGGWVCRRIGASATPVLVLGTLMLIFGVISGVVNMGKTGPGPRTADVPVMDAATQARQPSWYAFTVPVVGFVGVILGGSAFKKNR